LASTSYFVCVHCAVPEMRSVTHLHRVSVAMAKGKHPVPFRTRKLSPSAPMVLRGGLRGRVGRRRTSSAEGRYHAGSGPQRCAVLCWPVGGAGLRWQRNSRSRRWLENVWPGRAASWPGPGWLAVVAMAGSGTWSWPAAARGWPAWRAGRPGSRSRAITGRAGPAGSWWIGLPGRLPLAGRLDPMLCPG
jgi:hypothetical protein